MPNISSLESAPRRAFYIFYLLDTSGSMTGEPIARLNAAMEETTAALREVARHNADAQLKIAVLTFNSNVKWLQPMGPEDAEDFEWQDLSAGGLTNLGDALKELNSKLSQDQFLNSMTGAYLPTIIIMTDGQPTDDYIGYLRMIQQNKWFRRATKIGFAIGDMADADVISQVVGTNEAVIKTSDLSLFAKMIRFASVTSSIVNSKPNAVNGGSDGASIVREGLKNENIDPDTVVPSAPDDPSVMTPPMPPEKGFDTWDDPDDWD